MRALRRAGLAAALVVALLAPSALAAPAPAPEPAPALPATVKDAAGQTVTVRDTKRIVVLNGDIAEIVYALGQGGRVVGTDLSATYPAAARAKQGIGYQRTLSAEGILALRPTLVIGNTDAGPPAVLDQIKAAGVPLVHPAHRRPHHGRGDQDPQRGARARRPGPRGAAGGEHPAGHRRRAGPAQGRDATGPRWRSCICAARGCSSSAGRGSRSDTMILAAGGRDMGSELGISGTRPLTAESLVAAAPDVIVVLDAGLESVGGREGLMRLPGVAQTPAGESGRILSYDDLLFLGLGPRTGPALNDLISGLHPELR